MITVLADKKKNKDGQVSSWSSISNMEDLTNLLVTPSPNRTHGTHESQGVLIRAGPGTGKTVSLQQLTRLVCLRVQGATEPGVALVPMLLTVQRLASYIKKGVLEITSPDLLRAFIDIEYTGDDRNVLVQAYDMRALVCAIDGVDEAAGLKNKIEDLVINKLAPMGIRTVASSRPEGVRVERYAKFVTMDLAPLSEEQQRKAIAFQLKNSKEYDHLVILSKLRKERRASTPSTSPSDAEVLSALQSNAGESYDKIVAVVKAATPSKDPQIEFIRILDFFDLASTVPVMLSMLVLCLEDIATNKTGDPIPLPTSRLDLYTTAARASIRRLFPDDAVRAALATQMLARISVENHLAQRREYTSVDVATILGKFPEELALWHELESTTEGVPLVKILEVGSSGSPSEGQTEEELSKYQFKHLSFQEAFFAEGLMFQKDSSRALLSETLASEAQLVWKRGALRVLNDRWMLNSFTICGPALGPVVAGQLGQVADLHLTEHHVKVMAALAWEPLRGQSKLTSLALQVGFGIDFTNRSSPGVAHLEAILADLKEMPNLTKIDFGKPTNIGVGAAACICAAVEKRKGLRMYGSVSAGQFSGIGDADAVLIAATLRNCNGLTMDVSSATIATPSDGFPYIKLGSGSLAEALKSAGATAASFPKELANHLMFAGFTAADMSAAKYLSAELAEIGFAAWDILQTIGNGDPTPAALKELTACGLAMEIVCGGPNKVPLEDLVSAQCPGVPDVDKMDDACDTASNMPNYRSMKDASGVMDASKEGINDKNGAFLVWAVAVNCHNAVTELNFSRNQMGPLTCQALAQLLRFNKSITTLDLHSNGIDDAGAASLAKALSWNNTVSMIRLSMNNITNPGAVKIFEGLADNFSLEGIVMETSGQIVVTNGIPIPVLKGLKANELIDLSGRKFGPLSAAIIARLISTYRPVLTELGIDRNPIRSEGAAEIAEMLKTNNDIKELDIRFCGMGTEGTKHIAAALQVNTSVERVLMLQNQVPGALNTPRMELPCQCTNIYCAVLAGWQRGGSVFD